MGAMNYYDAKDIANSFRTVRTNTIQIAEDIPEEKYDFRPAPDARSVAQTLIHISNIPRFALMLHRDTKQSTLEGFDFPGFVKPLTAMEENPGSRAGILDRLREGMEEFASFAESLDEDYLGEVITMPAGGTPPTRTRFDMLIAVKEHEMHHRGQLMLIERMLGITPHLTRRQQERMKAMAAGKP
jgi:uncharacterized damage-inducible protein DinB